VSWGTGPRVGLGKGGSITRSGGRLRNICKKRRAIIENGQESYQKKSRSRGSEERVRGLEPLFSVIGVATRRA